MKHRLQHIHFVGIGGSGMSGIAEVLMNLGYRISGSDLAHSSVTQRLQELGARIALGHQKENVLGADAIVTSTAVANNNPEVIAAREARIPVVPRAVMLAELMRLKRGIAVAGTHGKTTTTSMVTIALQHCGVDPSFAIGSELAESGSNAHLGSGQIFVVEADESDGAFLHYSPFAGIVTNVEADHLNHWGTFEAIEAAFLEFATGIRDRGGFLVACADDAGAIRLAERARDVGVDVRTYGSEVSADYRMADLEWTGRGWSFGIDAAEVRLARIELQVPGRHNALNALAAFVTAVGLGQPAAAVAEGLSGFSGTRRRFDFKGEVAGIRVFDDYAHHPTEIEATLHAARDVAGSGRIVVAFQAHHYYRTAMFIDEFGAALGLADEVVVLEVFAPGETAIPGASGQTMAAKVPLGPEHVVFEPSWSAVAGHLVDRALSGDIIMTLGAGDIGMIGLEVLDLLHLRQGA